MKLYVISNKYQPLVTVDEQQFIPIMKKTVSRDDLQQTFDASEGDTLIACENKDDALFVASLLNTNPCEASSNIEEGVTIFAAPVVYTVEVDKQTLADCEKHNLTSYDLLYYADTTTIPLFSDKPSENNSSEIIDIKLALHSKVISIYPLFNLTLNATAASYHLDSSGKNIVEVNLTPVVDRMLSLMPFANTNMQILGGFIAAIGVAAVAIAFVTINAATLGVAGFAMAGLGMAAILVGGVGLFGVATYKKYREARDVCNSQGADTELSEMPVPN